MRPNYRSGSIASPRCAASGHETEAAAAPPSSAMNSRRFTATGSHASDRKIAHLGSALPRCEISNGLLTALGHSRRTSPRPPVLHARSTSKTGLSSRRCRVSRCAIGGSRAAKAAHQSALIPAALMILPHFCVSRFQNAARSCGEPDLCLAPNLARLASISGDCSTRLIN